MSIEYNALIVRAMLYCACYTLAILHDLLSNRLVLPYELSFTIAMFQLVCNACHVQQAMPDIDGALVGGASLDPEKFKRIINFVKK